MRVNSQNPARPEIEFDNRIAEVGLMLKLI